MCGISVGMPFIPGAAGGAAVMTQGKVITPGMFTGNDITGGGIPALLAGKTAVQDFNLFTDGGSGVLITPESGGYTFDSGTGVITVPTGPDDFMLTAYLIPVV